MTHSPLNFPTGVGGTLYPPHALPPEVHNQEAYMTLSPHADDVWFYAMLLMAHTKVVKSPTRNQAGDPLFNENLQADGLYQSINSRTDNRRRTPNDTQLAAVFNRYNLWPALRNP